MFLVCLHCVFCGYDEEAGSGCVTNKWKDLQLSIVNA